MGKVFRKEQELLDKMMKRTGSCNFCGDCCRGRMLFMSLSIQELNALKRFFSAEELLRMQRKGHKCDHLKEMEDGTAICKIHGHHPSFCKEFPACPEDIKGMERCSFKFVEENET